MNENGFKSNKPPAGKHRGYIFGVTFLAGFVAAIFIWPTTRPAYQSRAVLSIEREDGSKIQQEHFESRLKNASRDVLAEESLQRILGKVSNSHRGSVLFKPENREQLRAAVQIGIANGKVESNRRVSVTLNGTGTSDEVEFVNLVGNKLVAKLAESNRQVAQTGMTDEIRSQLRLSQARVRGMLNGAELISLQQNRKLAIVNSFNIPASGDVTRDIVNPAWETYRNRLRDLVAQRSQIELAMNSGLKDFDTILKSSTVREEIRVLKSQFAREPETIQFESHHVATANREETEPLPVIQSDYDSDLQDGPSIRRNKFFSQKAEQPVSVERNIQMVSHQETGTAQATIIEVSAQVRSEESQQARLQSAMASQASTLQDQPQTEFSRLLEPAIKAQPLGSGVSGIQFLLMLIFSTGFASVVTWASGSVVSGNKFRTAEEVSRKLRMAVMGVVPVSDQSVSLEETTHSKIVRRTILGCELLLIAFAIIMLATTVLHSEIFSAIRQDPMTGFMEAIRTIRPW